MSFNKWATSRMKKLKWQDISLIKISVAAFVLMIAKFWEPLLSLEWYWYIIIALLAAFPVYSKVLGK